MDKNYTDITDKNYLRLISGQAEREHAALAEKELGSKTVYDGRILKLRLDDVLLSDGTHSKREYVEHRGGAAALPVDDDGYVYLVEQFRYPYREVTAEIPAGKLEKDEDPMLAAARELEEETGLKAEEISPCGVIYPSPGYTNEKLYIYVAKGLSYVGEHPDRDEFLHVVRMPFSAALQHVLRGEIRDGKTCFALLKTAYLDATSK